MLALEQYFLDFLDFDVLTHYFTLQLLDIGYFRILLLPRSLNLLLYIFGGVAQVLLVLGKLV